MVWGRVGWGERMGANTTYPAPPHLPLSLPPITSLCPPAPCLPPPHHTFSKLSTCSRYSSLSKQNMTPINNMYFGGPEKMKHHHHHLTLKSWRAWCSKFKKSYQGNIGGEYIRVHRQIAKKSKKRKKRSEFDIHIHTVWGRRLYWLYIIFTTNSSRHHLCV